jgi:hypothetical protein
MFIDLQQESELIKFTIPQEIYFYPQKLIPKGHVDPCNKKMPKTVHSCQLTRFLCVIHAFLPVYIRCFLHTPGTRFPRHYMRLHAFS